MKHALQHAISILFPALTAQACPNPHDLRYVGDDRVLVMSIDDRTTTAVVLDRSSDEVLSQHQATDVNSLLASLTTESALPDIPLQHLYLHNEEPRWMTAPMLWHHATDGEPHAGYGGSGPADTALSILCHFIPPDGPQTDAELRRTLGYPEDPDREEAYLDSLDEQAREVAEDRYWRGYVDLPVRLRSGTYAPRLAYLLHQDFKQAFLENAPDGLITLKKIDIKQWIQTQQDAGI